MATQYWGVPEVLTVEASPTPTTTVFTVSDATNILYDSSSGVGQYILVEVSGDFERTQVTDKTGDALTVSPALTAAPDVPGEVRNARQLITNSILNGGGLFNASTPADLKTIDTTYAINGIKYWVDGYGLYTLDLSSTADADGIAVVEPTAGTGRWFLKVQEGGGDGGGAAASILQYDSHLLRDRIEIIEQSLSSFPTIANNGAFTVYETVLFDDSITASSDQEFVFRIPTLKDNDLVFHHINFPNANLSVVHVKIDNRLLYVTIRNVNTSAEDLDAIPFKFLVLNKDIFSDDIERIV